MKEKTVVLIKKAIETLEEEKEELRLKDLAWINNNTDVKNLSNKYVDKNGRVIKTPYTDGYIDKLSELIGARRVLSILIEEEEI